MIGLSDIGLALAAGVGYCAAVLLHELTHIIVVWPVSRRIGVDLKQMSVTAEVPDMQPHKAVADAAGLAPVVVGVFAVIAFARLGHPLPALWEPVGLAAWACWLRYTVGGGFVDFVPSLGWSDHEAEASAAGGD